MIWMRRIVPNGYVLANLKLHGTSALLMSSGVVDRDGELFRAFTVLADKRDKSLDDETRLREMEWKLRLYFDKDHGPFIPSANLKELLRESATKWKLGADIQRSLIFLDERIPLIYDGPRGQESLWKAGYRYTAMVANSGFNRGRVVRCRPMFKQWALDADLAFDPEDLDFDKLQVIVERSQKYCLGDYRPTFGSFRALLTLKTTRKSSARGSGEKVKDAEQSRGHRAHVARITT